MLTIVCCVLFDVCRSSFGAVGRLLVAMGRLLLVVWYLICAVCCVLFDVCRSLCAVFWLLFVRC